MGKLIPVALLLITVLYSGIASNGKVSALKAATQAVHTGSRSKNDLVRQLSVLKLSAANTDFALRLYRQIASQPSSTAKNIFFSPVSISSSLAMLSLGAKHNTRDQLLRVLGYYNMSKNDAAEVHVAFKYLLQELTSEKCELHLTMGSSLHIQQGLNLQKKFLEDTRQFYNAEAIGVDFKAVDKAKKKINTYVRKQTNGKIQEFIKTLNRNTLMILLNYVLFKGKWVKPFDPQDTYEDDFHVDDTTTVKVQMMKRRGRYSMNYDNELASSVILIPYKGNASLVLILPDPGKLTGVEQNLTITSFQNLINSLRIGSVDLRLPKLSLKSSYQLKHLLIAMGILDVFSNNANLSKITKSAPLYVSKVVHEAVLDVDERGAEATAATGVGLMPMSRLPQLKLNRPFLLLIAEHNTKSVLFAGRVMNPNV
ncbi:alpha-1-antitrypsin-like [Carcharodon carcharias]|uniref:alpha-1-antitrypsin-like n=1 Tax=Carcharodon carcharias TaxID=13397 RepID=UPI001B7DD897|nr:alpha-1-antitrypsin-like [Carcharodon carcharias]